MHIILFSRTLLVKKICINDPYTSPLLLEVVMGHILSLDCYFHIAIIVFRLDYDYSVRSWGRTDASLHSQLIQNQQKKYRIEAEVLKFESHQHC